MLAALVQKIKKMGDKKQKAAEEKPAEELQTNSVNITINGRILSDHPANRINPLRLKEMFDAAENGDIRDQHELFENIEERDSAILSAISTRKNAILTLDYRVVAPRNPTPAEEELTKVVDELIDGISGLNDLFLDCLDAIGHGFSALEIRWQLIDGKYVPVEFIRRPQSWFRWNKDDRLLLKTPDNYMGEELWPLGWLVHEHKTRSTQAARNGLFRTLAWLYMYKHYSVSDFAEFLELYGMPIRIGKYPDGATEKDKATLLRAVAEIGHNAAGIMPERMAMEIMQATSGNTGTNNPFQTMIDWCEKSAARLILGQTLTSGADGKSSTNALGQVHNQVRRDLAVSDAKRLEETIKQQIILPYLQINYPNIDPRRCPIFEFDTRETEDLAPFADALPKLVDVGMQIPETWARQKLAIPDAQENEPLLARAVVPEPAALSARHATGCPCGCSASTVALNAQASKQTTQGLLDSALDEALTIPDFNQQLDPIVKQAVATLTACNSYEEASSALVALYPNLDNSTLQQYMQNALYLSDLLGQADAKR